MRTITLEEHFTTPDFLDGPGRTAAERRSRGAAASQNDSNSWRRRRQAGLADMDAAGIDMQVLSLTSPGAEQLEAAEALALAREANDFLAEAVKRHPKRFAGLAALPTAAPDKAAAELELRVRQQGFIGAVIHGHNRGRYLDNKFFWPILEAAETLNAPIYLHPTPPPQGGHRRLLRRLRAGGHRDVRRRRAGAGTSRPRSTSSAWCSAACSTAFPKLQFVIGHLGEALPFMLPRLRHHAAGGDQAEAPGQRLSARQRALHHFRLQFPAGFLDLLLEVGVDRIMFSADHPYASMAAARAFLEHIPVSAADRERIAHGNAEKLFNL